MYELVQPYEEKASLDEVPDPGSGFRLIEKCVAICGAMNSCRALFHPTGLPWLTPNLETRQQAEAGGARRPALPAAPRVDGPREGAPGAADGARQGAEPPVRICAPMNHRHHANTEAPP